MRCWDAMRYWFAPLIFLVALAPATAAAVPRDSNAPFDMRAIVEMIVDKDSFFARRACARNQTVQR